MKDLTLLIKPVSSACQYACKYCFYREETALRQKTNAAMTLSTLEAIVRKAFAAAERRVTFAFQGGEPTLAGMDFFREVTKLQKRYAREKSYVNTLQQTAASSMSNGRPF